MAIEPIILGPIFSGKTILQKISIYGLLRPHFVYDQLYELIASRDSTVKIFGVDPLNTEPIACLTAATMMRTDDVRQAFCSMHM